MPRTNDRAREPKVSIVIVNYNSGAYLAACIKSLIHSTNLKIEVLVVDNGSTDRSVRYAARQYPALKVIRNRANLGFSAAANAGIIQARGEYVIVMNPDVRVRRGWIESMLDASKRYPRAAFFQPKILLMDRPKLLNSAGNMIHAAGFGICRGLGLPDSREFQDEYVVSYASGAALMARRSALAEIGLLDDVFFSYGEDKDWGWRGAMMGWQSVYVPSAVVLHKWSFLLGKSASKMHLLELERLISLYKNYSRRTLILLLPVLMVVEAFVLAHATTQRWLRAKVASYVDAIRLRSTLAQKRRLLQKQRRFSDRTFVGEFLTDVEHPYIGSSAHVLNRLIRAFRFLMKSI